MLERLKTLSELPGISGRENAVRRFIREESGKMGLKAEIDAMGNVTVHKEGKGRRVLLCAHMDEKGFLAAGISSDGLISCRNNDVDPRVVVSKRVQVGPQRIAGVIGAKAFHLQSKADRETVTGHENLYVDIGAKDKASAEAKVRIGDGIAFATGFGPFGDGLVKGKALEGRAGCAILLDLLQESYDCDLYAVFTSMAHIGRRGAQAAAWNVAPDLVLSIEAVEAGEPADPQRKRKGIGLGSGPVLCTADSVGIPSESLLAALENSASGPIQRAVLRTGSDALTVAMAFSGCFGASVALPCRRMYTPCEIASEEDLRALRGMLHNFFQERRFDEVKI